MLMKLCICLSSKWSHLRLTWSPFLKPWADNSSTNQYSYQLFYSWGMTHLAPSYLKNAYYGRGAWWNSLRSLLPDSVQFSRSVVSNSLRPHELQHARPPCPSPTPRVHPNPCPSSPWYHPTTSSSVVPFSSCPQSFPASGSYLINSFLTDIKQLAKTSGVEVGWGVALSVPLLMSMSEDFSVPFYTLIKLCYTKALEWSRLVPGPQVKPSSEITNRTPFTISYHPIQQRLRPSFN